MSNVSWIQGWVLRASALIRADEEESRAYVTAVGKAPGFFPKDAVSLPSIYTQKPCIYSVPRRPALSTHAAAAPLPAADEVSSRPLF